MEAEAKERQRKAAQVPNKKAAVRMAPNGALVHQERSCERPQAFTDALQFEGVMDQLVDNFFVHLSFGVGLISLAEVHFSPRHRPAIFKSYLQELLEALVCGPGMTGLRSEGELVLKLISVRAPTAADGY